MKNIVIFFGFLTMASDAFAVCEIGPLFGPKEELKTLTNDYDIGGTLGASVFYNKETNYAVVSAGPKLGNKVKITEGNLGALLRVYVPNSLTAFEITCY